LDAGFVEVANPYNSGQIRRVSLLPTDAEILVFWTRDPGAILKDAENLENQGYRFYVMTTLTGYPGVLEPNMPSREEVIGYMRELGKKLGPERIIWRYDPLFLSTLTDLQFHLANFRALARALEGRVRRVIISFYDEYPRTKKRISEAEGAKSFRMLPCSDDTGSVLPEVRALLAAMVRDAGNSGIRIQTCAEAEDLSSLGIGAGSCIDGELIRNLWGVEAGEKDRYQRPRCLCVSALDIGAYGSCPGGCVYCYARR
jgi:hypothetical protein